MKRDSDPIVQDGEPLHENMQGARGFMQRSQLYLIKVGKVQMPLYCATE